jgi:hypothetical protein
MTGSKRTQLFANGHSYSEERTISLKKKKKAHARERGLPLN